MPEITVLAGYAISALLLTGSVRSGPDGSRGRTGLILTAVTVAAHGWLLWRAAMAGDTPNLSLSNTLSLVGWTIGILVLVASLRPALRGVAGLLLLPAGAAALVTGIGPADIAHGAQPAWQINTHALLATTASGLLAAAAVLAVLMVVQDRSLRRRSAPAWGRALPPLETTERLLFIAIAAGFALLTLAIFSGFAFVRNIYAQHLTHKTVLTLLAWALFGVLLLGRWRFGWRGRVALNWTLSGFVTLLLAYFGSRFVLEVLLGRQWG